MIPETIKETTDGGLPCTPCSASSRIEAMKAAQKFHLLATYPHIQPEAIADHYTKLAAVAMQLRELVGMRQYHKSSPDMDAAIARLTKEIVEHHRADFGIELSWQNSFIARPVALHRDNRPDA